jgi:hypothetical protein
VNDRDELDQAVRGAREKSPFAPSFLEREFETYNRLRQHLPVARFESLGVPVLGGPQPGWVLTRYDRGSEVLRNTADFSSQTANDPVRPWIPPAVDPRTHTAPTAGFKSVVHGGGDVAGRAAPPAGCGGPRGPDAPGQAFEFVAEFADPGRGSLRGHPGPRPRSTETRSCRKRPPFARDSRRSQRCSSPPRSRSRQRGSSLRTRTTCHQVDRSAS